MELKDLSTVTLADIQRAQELIKLAKHAIRESTVDEAVGDMTAAYRIINTGGNEISIPRSELTGFKWDDDEELAVVTKGGSHYLAKSNGIKFLHDIGVNLPYPY